MSHPSTSERMFAVVAIAFFAKALLPLTSGFEIGEYSAEGAAVGNIWDQAIGGLIYVVAGVLLAREVSPFRVAMVNPFLTAFILLAIVSAMWSVAPEASLRRAIGLLGTAIFAAYLAFRFPPHEVLRISAAALAIVIALSLFLIVYVPSYGTADGTQFGGVYGHKNDLGRAMVVAALALWAVVRTPAFNRPIWALASLPLAAVLVVISESAQSIVGFAFGFGVMLPLVVLCSRWFKRITFRLGAFLIVVATVLGVLGTMGADAALALLGRDATLTDRTIIWEMLLEFGRERALLGYGYGAFWLSDVTAWFIHRWNALDHAHNGFMDLWLELGYVGAGAFALLLLSASREAWNAYLARPSSALAFFPAFLAVAALINLVARVFPAHNSIYWMLVCYCALMRISMTRAEKRATLRSWRGDVSSQYTASPARELQ